LLVIRIGGDPRSSARVFAVCDAGRASAFPFFPFERKGFLKRWYYAGSDRQARKTNYNRDPARVSRRLAYHRRDAQMVDLEKNLRERGRSIRAGGG
jgi:hypothetical protein